MAVAGSSPLAAWQVGGHAMVAHSAVELLPGEVPAFFRGGAETVAHAAIDPDLYKLRATPQLRDQESPEHYFDSEYLAGVELPPTRYEFLALVAQRELDGSRVGLLPYALTEAVQRLTIAFAEHRRWPQSRPVESKALHIAGHIAHYAGDLCQPLHTTIHYDGRAGADLASPSSGIHRRVDSLFERVQVDLETALEGVELVVAEDVFATVLAEFDASFRLVDRVYELEPLLEWDEGSPAPAATIAFTRDRYACSARFIASLYLSAWRMSADLEIPDWIQRHEAEAHRGGAAGCPWG